MELVVRSHTDESDGIISLTLARSDGGELPAWDPGAHVDLTLPDGISRSYSLCSDPADASTWRIGVLREAESRGGSVFLHDQVRPGTVLEVSAPLNNFAFHRSPSYLFVAGGVGITPILPMIAAAENLGARWQLFYGGRTRSSMAFTEELARYGDRVTLVPQDEEGLLDLPRIFKEDHSDTLIYACGPAPMLAAVELATAHWPAHALRLEHFTSKEIDTAEDVAFEVEFTESGIEATVPPGTSILEVAEGLGINVFSSCREGTCGTCETRIVEGRAEHRDQLLTEAEKQRQDTMFICMSRAARGCPRLKLAL